MKRLLCLSSIIALLIPGATDVWGQFHSNPRIFLPYEGAEITGLGLEGELMPLSDRIPNILENPAELAYLKSPRLYASVTSEFVDATFNTISQDTIITQQSLRLRPGSYSLALPFKLMHRSWAVAASFNGQYYPVYIPNSFSIERPYREYSWEQSGNISSASFGVSMQALPRASIGIGWTKWFGDWEEINASVDTSITPYYSFHITDTYRYGGSFLNIGFTSRLNKMTVGLVAYFPTELIEWRSTNINDHQLPAESPRQKYRGALKASMTYAPRSNLTIGIAYRYQAKITTEDYSEYLPSTKLAIGIGYTPKFNQVRVPLFITYTGHWMPVTEYFLESDDEAKRFSNNLTMGLNVLSGGLGIHAVVGLTRYPIQVQTDLMWRWPLFS